MIIILMQKYDDLPKVFKALSNPNRFRLFLKILHSGEDSFEERSCLLSDLVCQFSIGAPTVSHHLKELVNAGLITTEKKGKYIICKLNKDKIVTLGGIFDPYSKKVKEPKKS